MDEVLILPNKIIIKNEVVNTLGEILLKEKYKKILLITGLKSLKDSQKYYTIINSLEKNKIKFFVYSGIETEPTPEIIDKVTDFAKNKKVDAVIGIGGGSVLDTAKAVAALVNNKKGVENYLEGVGKGYKIINPTLPFIAIPTTSGSGAEATYNSVVRSIKKRYKKSFRDERLVAKIVIIDPTLTFSLPLKQTIYSGMDAFCQLIESFVSKKRKNYPIALASYYLPKVKEAISKLKNNLNDTASREIMSQASLASGIALANSGLGAVHGFASGIGGAYEIPHGLLCAILLPGVCKINASKSPEIYNELAKVIFNDSKSDHKKLIDFLYDLNKELDIPSSLKDFKIGKDKAEEIVVLSKGSSMNGNPVELSDKEWIDFITQYL